jgi:hypothetical protein
MNQQKIEQFALGQFLSEYPDGMSYHDVLDLIYEEDDSVVIWEPFEHYSPTRVVEHIEGMVLSMNCWFKEEITNE